MMKNLPAMQETRVQSLGREDPLEKRMATHSSILVWRIPWTWWSTVLGPWGRSMGQDWRTNTFTLSLSHDDYNKKKFEIFWDLPNCNTYEVRKCCCTNGAYRLDWLRLAINHQCEKTQQNKTGVSSNRNEANWTKTEMCQFFPVNVENCRHNKKKVILTGNSPDEKLTHWNYKREIRLQMNHQKVCFVLNSAAHYILEN